MSPSTSFGHDLLASAPQWAVALVLAAGGTFWLAGVWDARLIAYAASWLVIGLVLMPVGFVLGLSAVAAVLTVLLAVLALPAWLTGRATGLRELLGELWGLAGHVLPGFWSALRRVRRPSLWGASAGVVAGILVFIAIHGFEPAA